MKKKRFLRLSIVSIIILSLGALLFIGGSIYIVVYPFTTDEVFIYGIPRQLYCVFSIILAFFVGIPIFCYEALEFYAGAICLDNEGIRSKGDILGKARKIQYPAFVPYTEIKSIDIVNKDGISTINAKIFIDATGDGDLAVEAGIPFTLGRESDNATQPLTMNMKVYGVDTSKLKKTVLQNPKKFPRLNRDIEVMKKVEALSFVGFEEEFKRAKELGEITIPREDVLFFETSTPGEYIINTTRIINENGASALGLTNAEIIGRKQCEELYKFLIKYVPGFENSKIAYTGPSVGVRGSRQIQGVYKLTGEDLLEQKRFNSVIAHSGYPIDIHNPKGEGTLSVHVNKQEESKEAKFDRSTFDSYYSIPYEIMITKEIQNLIVTGRCVSASFEAQAAIRTTPTMTALGQAAGTAAALAIQTNQSVNKIDIKNLQNLLIAQGSYIEKK